ncbi:hypothetical protein [Candidatus Methylacidithermus pantelleriae]|uniref:Uncharacterized protein n=1 Tax=Candidatus Methylacidithermus pantelleriae TaxID=2744239 RepID=A0A8J2BP26_9BACT|nr:hypothetical protein [Candidatus Methylacidithermus pantelleriae]CAF0700300.1 hypothetical protein MPNT_350004 [Candidatus Methylacidithermus pantelleriae]
METEESAVCTNRLFLSGIACRGTACVFTGMTCVSRSLALDTVWGLTLGFFISFSSMAVEGCRAWI